MVNTIKVLKRKDGSSLVVGVALGLFVSQFITTITTDVSTRISNIGLSNNVGGQGWRGGYFMPAVIFVVQLVALEILVWLYGYAHAMMDK